MTWQKALRTILSKHLDEVTVEGIIENIASEKHQGHLIPTSQSRGFMMSTGTSAYVLSFLYFSYPNKILYRYSMDEKGGISPNVAEFPLTEEDFQIMESIEELPSFSIYNLSRIMEAPYLNQIIDHPLTGDFSLELYPFPS